MKPEISVILAVYNEDKYLKRCLESLAKQKKANFEVLVIDDGSYRKVDNKPFSSFENFKFFRIKHSGTAKARNFGAKKAQGKILVFIDGDMEFEPDFLEKLTAPVRKGEAKGTFSTQELVANWNNVWARCWNWENKLPGRKRIDPRRLNMVRDFRAILKSEFQSVGGFEDIGYTDTWTLAEKLNYLPQAVNNAKYYHYNPDNLNEVFRQAAWIGSRRRKFGIIGKSLALLRATIPISVLSSLLVIARKRELNFLIFKIIYDLGIFTGIIGSL